MEAATDALSLDDLFRRLEATGIMLPIDRSVTPLRTAAGVVQDPDVLQPHQRLHDLARLGHDEGASNLLAHTSS